MLTTNGMAQQRANGADVYENYVRGAVAKVLPTHWDMKPDAFYVRSTDIERTFLSAESLFAGIYENVTAPSKTDNIDVLTINSVELTVENMYPNPVICPAQGTWQTAASQTPTFKVPDVLCVSLRRVVCVPSFAYCFFFLFVESRLLLKSLVPFSPICRLRSAPM